jgi:hypothetical protein
VVQLFVSYLTGNPFSPDFQVHISIPVTPKAKFIQNNTGKFLMAMISFLGAQNLANQCQDEKHLFPSLKFYGVPLIFIPARAWEKRYIVVSSLVS